MKPAKGGDRQRMAQDMAKQSIATILAWPQTVAMLDSTPPTGKRSLPGTHVVVDADILAQDRATPAIVISRDHQNRSSRFPQFGERRQDSEAPSRDDRSPLEPELEQVSIDDERSGPSLQLAQKPQQISLYFGLREAEMQV
jgi:hypothetical protein